MKKWADILMNEMQPMVFEKGRYVLQQKSDLLYILVIWIQKVSDARIIPEKSIIERCSQDRKLLVETIIEIEDLFEKLGPQINMIPRICN